jgi:tRNA nucleotidyltransferase/poly(A) polymerase
MLQVVADILRRRGTEGWLVGGSVRDLGLGRFSSPAREPVDLDIVVADDPRAVARELAKRLDVPWFPLSERHAAYRVMGGEGHVDVAGVRGDGILSDLAERDYTVNAMALSLAQVSPRGGLTDVDPAMLVDPFGGLRDLEQRRLAAVSDHIFADDPLRMMRAVRFHHVLGFELDEPLCETIRAQAPLLAVTAAERVSAELALTLTEGRTEEALDCWERLGLLRVVLPEIPPASVGAVRQTLACLDRLLHSPASWVPEGAELLAERLARPVDGALSRPVALRLAALTHRLSPDEATRAGKRLKLSADAVSLLVTVARFLGEGSRPAWPALPPSGPPGREAVLFMWRSAPWEPEVILLAAATEGDTEVPQPARRLLQLWGERSRGQQPPLPVDGESLMRHLSLSSGPRLGAVIREVRLAWEAGEISTLPEVLARARSCSACES